MNNDALQRAYQAREKGVQWLLAHIDENGMPQGSDDSIGWSRVPWALALSGKLTEAAAVLEWAERSEQFDDQGRFMGKAGDAVYMLGHYAIGAFVLEQYDIADRTMDVISEYVDEANGFPTMTVNGHSYSNLLTVSQAGLAAITTGRKDLAKTAYAWVCDTIRQQPEMEQGILYTMKEGENLITDIPQGLDYVAKVDFSKGHQAYFYPGITAAFLIAFMQRYGKMDAAGIPEKLLTLNRSGSQDFQYGDKTVMQVCKYGWGVAALMKSDHEKYAEWRLELEKMACWFADVQHEDGAWAPSTFLNPKPIVADKMGKTAEHVMELNVILTAFGGLQNAGKDKCRTEKRKCNTSNYWNAL